MLKKAPQLDVYIDAPPGLLGAAGQELWSAMLADRDLPTERERRILFMACAATDRAAAFAVEIEKHGVIIESKTGNLRENPAVKSEKDYLSMAARWISWLNPQGPGSPGRPAGRWRIDAGHYVD